MFDTNKVRENLKTLKDGILAQIKEFGEQHAKDGTYATKFALGNPDSVWNGLETMNVLRIDFNAEIIIIDLWNGNEDERYYPDADVETLIAFLEHLVASVK